MWTQRSEFKEAEVPQKIISRLEIHREGKVLQKTAWGSHGFLDEYKDMYAYSETLCGLERTPLGKKTTTGKLKMNNSQSSNKVRRISSSDWAERGDYL